MIKIPIPPVLQKMQNIFSSEGFEAYLVGGAVRDFIMSKKAADFDVATNATPQQVLNLFHHVIPTGIEHGTVTVILMNTTIEVTTYRTENAYTDGRHPDKVAYAATIEEDLSRRDFTMNAIAADLKTGSLIDPFNGQKDIKDKIIRTVGNPKERFSEDGLRPVRAIRFASQLNFDIEIKTFEAISISLETVKKVAIERFQEEFKKIMKSPLPSKGLFLLEKTGLMEIFLPELLFCRGCLQKGFHSYDVLDHLYYTADGAPSDNLDVRLAALFHDIGKPAVCAQKPSGEYTFYQHEKKSAEICETIMNRLRFPKSTVTTVSHLVRQHMFFYEDNWTDAAVRRFLVRIGYRENPAVLDNLFLLRRADIYGMRRLLPPPELLIPFQNRIGKILLSQNALSVKDLAVNGQILIENGIPSGKHMGIILKELLETVLEDPSANTKEKLILIAGNIYKKLSSY